MDELKLTCARFFSFSRIPIYCYSKEKNLLFHFPDNYSALTETFVKECFTKEVLTDSKNRNLLIITLNQRAHLAMISLSNGATLFIGPIALNPDEIPIISIYQSYTKRQRCIKMSYEKFLNAAAILQQLCTGESTQLSELITAESISLDIGETFHDTVPNPNLIISYSGEALEQRLMTLIERGDVERLKTQLELSTYIPIESMSTNPLQHQKYLFIVFMTMSVRAAIRGGLDDVQAFGLVGQYCLKMDKCTDISEIASNMYNMALSLCREVRKYAISVSLSVEIRKCCTYILSHLYSELDLTKIANAVNMSTRNLSKRFLDEMNTTPISYVQSARIEEAKFLLHHTSYSILEISNALRFSSQSHFTKVFRTATQMTPRQYKEIKMI